MRQTIFKSLVVAVPALLGVLVVFQAGINRKIAMHWGMSSAVFLNAVIMMCIAALVFTLSMGANRPEWIPPQIQAHVNLQTFAPWFLLPGLIGFLLVLGGPLSIARWGAVHTFVLLISAQLATSLLWDWRIEHLPVSKMRIVGVLVTWIGVLLVCKGR